MLEPSWFFWGGVMPALIAAALVGGGCLVWPGRAWLGVGGALAVWAGFSWGYVASVGWPPWPPRESTHWLVLVLVPVATAIAVGASIPKLPRWLVWAGRIALAVALAPVLLQSYLAYTWERGESAVWIAALGVATIVLWGCSPQSAGKPGQLSVALIALYSAIISIGTGMVMMFSGSVTLGQLSFGLAATLAGVGSASLFVHRGRPASDSGVVGGPVLVPLIGLWINGHFYASVTGVNALLLAASWLAMGAVSLSIVGGVRGWRRFALQAVGVLLPVAAAVINAAITFSKQVAEPSYY